MVNMFRIRKEIGSFSSPIAVLDGKRRRDLGESPKPVEILEQMVLS